MPALAAAAADRLIKGAGIYRTMLSGPTQLLRLLQVFCGFCVNTPSWFGVMYLGTAMIGTMY